MLIVRWWDDWPELRLAAFALPVQLAWEWGQMPLYKAWGSEPLPTLAGYALHCTAGDLMILLGSYWMTSLITGSRRFWRSSIRYSAIFVSFGLVYTVGSEWINVYALHRWDYSSAMPVTPWLGIGLSPLIQWAVLPPLLLVAIRLTEPAVSASRD